MTTSASRSSARKAGAANEWVEIGKTVVYALLIAAVIRILLFQPFTIPSASMEPTLFQGDYIIVSKFTYGYSRFSSAPVTIPGMQGRLFDHLAHRGDIVVFKLPRDGKTDYIKRLIGLPGDTIQMKQGVVWLNGKPLPRQELAPATETSPFGFSHPVQRFRETLPGGKSYITYDYGPDGDVDNTGVYVVPPRSYFMMGDNRDNSQDSRYPESIGVGYVPEENLVGKAQIILLSWDDKASIFKPWTWFLDAKPSRFFHILH
ncbi:MAG: signal peptidase I [Caulobacteraceae bacterium]